jgi:HK97 family phage prohead protease
MNKLFNLTSTFKSHEADDGSVMIRGMASTADFDRAGDSISAEAWTKGGLSNFEKNPIILFNHDYDKPIGRATGLKAGPDGLELECKISKAAPANVAQLVKDGVLGAFSVGFRVKDADYLKETDGLMIKDAELFEVSVVSVPCNQSATFSLAKSFDSDKEYEEFKKTFTNRVDLAGQSLAKDEVNTSSVASDTPKSAEKSADQEIKMDNQNIDLEAFAKKVAEDTAAKIAMKQAEQKAADEATAKAAQEAEEAKALEAQSIKTVINSGVESGIEKLMGDVEAKLAEKDANLQDVIGSFQKELEEKKAEIEAMQTSKKSFSDRGSDLSSFGRDFLGAHVLGKITGKGIQGTEYGRSVFEKAGNTSYTANNGTNEAIDTLISQTFEEDVRLAQQVAGLFRELPVSSGATILPVIGDTNMARFQGTGLNTSNNSVLSAKDVNNGTDFPVTSVTAYAERLISGTFLPADTDEQVVLSLIPMLTASLARAHARAVDNACLYGYGTANKGLVGVGGAVTGSATGYAGAPPATASDGLLTGSTENASLKVNNLLHARSKLGSYGVNPADVAYIVSPEQYHNLMSDDTGNGFTDISEVGTELATKITGTVGSVYGSPVVVSDLLTGQDIDQTDSSSIRNTAAIAVNRNSFVIPRLRGVSIETDYEVANQRTALVASQSLGFVQTVGSTNAAFRIAFTETAD